MRKNIAKPDRPQITIWHMRIACWIPKVTDTYRICICFSIITMVTRTRLNVTLYVH